MFWRDILSKKGNYSLKWQTYIDRLMLALFCIFFHQVILVTNHHRYSRILFSVSFVSSLEYNSKLTFV